MIRSALSIGALLTAACSASSAPDQSASLPASELTYFKESSGWALSLTIDPWLASRPELVRTLRTEFITSNPDYDCGRESGCSKSSQFSLLHDGPALVSLTNEVETDGGGAHPFTTANDYLYDTAARKKIRFGDIFVSWSKARPIVQSLFCENLKRLRESVQTCPDVQKQAIGLASFPFNSPASALVVQTQDYALGSYAEGRESVHIELNRALFAIIRKEYQSDFEAQVATETTATKYPVEDGISEDSSSPTNEFEAAGVADEDTAYSLDDSSGRSWDAQPFARATAGLGQLYLSRARCPVSWMNGRALLIQTTGVVWEMCWREDKSSSRLITVCNVSPELTRKNEVGACMPASKSMFVNLSSLPRSAF